MDTATLLEYLLGFPKYMLPALLVFFLPLRKKRRWAAYLLFPLLAIPFCVSLDAVLWNMFAIGQFASVLMFAIHYLLICLIFATSFRLMCGVPWHEAWYCVIFAYISEHIVYCINNLGIFLTGSAAWWSSKPMEWLVSIVTYGCIWFFYARRICPEGHYSSTALRSLGLVTAVFALLYAISIVTIQLELEWLHALYALSVCGFIMVSEYRSVRQAELQEEIQSKERMWALNRAQYEMNRENIEIINRKCHDLRHQVAALRSLDNQKDKDNAIREMEQAVMIYDAAYQTGNPALDTVLTQKALLCSQQEIPLSVIADGALLSFIDPIDLYTMVANILDNAIEANLRIAQKEKRSIHLAVHERKGLIILQAENPYDGEVQMKDGLPLTSKSDKVNHGFGSRSIAWTAEKYGGILRLRPENGMYVLRIVFTPQDDAK